MRQSASMRCYSHNITQRNNTVYIFHILFGIWLFRVNDEQWLARYYRIPPIIKSAIFSISAKLFHFASYQAPISKLWHQREDRFQQRFSQNTWQVTIEFHSVSYLTMSLLYWSTVRYDWRPSIKNGQRNNIERWNWFLPLRWRYDERDGVSNHLPLDYLVNRLFRRRSTKTSTLHVTGLCEGNPTVTDGFPSQRTSNAENVSVLMTSSCNVLLC